MMKKSIVLDEVNIPSDLHFFILEDTSVFQRKMVESLKSAGFVGEITMASSLAEAFETFTNARPDFILSDWNLPDGAGIDFLTKVRASETFKNIPFLMITTVDGIDDILEAVNQGVDGYIVKPWSKQDFNEKIAFAYSKHIYNS
jgi:two-component system chemotaxis response regulator CheY